MFIFEKIVTASFMTPKTLSPRLSGGEGWVRGAVKAETGGSASRPLTQATPLKNGPLKKGRGLFMLRSGKFPRRFSNFYV
jgi:hypothetical protein